MEPIIINELLCFVSTQFDKLTRQNLNSIVLEYYSKDDLVAAKHLLVNICDKIGLSNNVSDFKIKRIGSNVEQKLVKDLLDIWDVIDAEKGGNIGTTFVAADPNRLPSVDADKFNLQFLVSIVLKIQEENQSLKSQLEAVVSSVTALHEKFPQQNGTPLNASPLLQTPPFASPRRQLPTPKENAPPAADNAGKRHLDANIPSFVPRQSSETEPIAVSTAVTASSVATDNLSLAPFLLKNSGNNKKNNNKRTPLAPAHGSPVLATSASTPLSPSFSASTVKAVTSAESTTSPAVAEAASIPPQATNPSSSGPTSASTKWNLVVARNKKKIIPVTGQVVKSSDDDLEGVPPVTRDFWDLSVSRLKETATADKVKSHLHKYGIEVKDVFILSSKIRGTKSAKVRVAREHRDRAKSPDIWPQHCKIADWVHFKKSERPVVNNGLL